MDSLAQDGATETGEVFGKYLLLGPIASGGMSEVFRAVSSSISGFRKELALKRVLPELTTDAEFVSLFIEEAKLTVALHHGNIVQVFDFGCVDNSYFLAMELVEGKDMAHVLVDYAKTKRGLPLDAALYVFVEALRGLEYAHTKLGPDGRPIGIVHRDVSPHNILVSYDGEVKLADFGVAKARAKVSLARPGVLFGKFGYMSPEQARGEDVDPRSDVYTAGITLYETLSGRRLFYAANPRDQLARVRDPKVRPPSRYNADISRRLDEIVMTALAVRPANRFESARAFGEALETELLDISPGFNDSHLALFMKSLYQGEVGAARFAMAAGLPAKRRASVRAMTPRPAAGRDGAVSVDDPVLMGLREKILDEPSLWSLVELADHLLRMGRGAQARRALRVAGQKFAQNGLLVQAVALYVRLRDMDEWSSALAEEVRGLRLLAGASSETLLACLELPGPDELSEVLEAVVRVEPSPETSRRIRAPLFGHLDDEEFVNLVSLLRLRDIPPGTTITGEGEPGDFIGIVVRGRVLIYCRNFHGEKVYLSSLYDGDCFGEFSFFTGEPRTATAESLEQVLLFQIRRADFEIIQHQCPSLTHAMLEFYKSRVAAILIAKSDVFGVLRSKERNRLLDEMEQETRGAGDLIIAEGDTSEGFYLIKSGEVEVYSEKHGYVRISRLKSGEFFGEMAALTGQPRRASVRAVVATDLLRIPGSALKAILEATPEARRLLEDHILRREAESARCLTAGGQLI